MSSEAGLLHRRVVTHQSEVPVVIQESRRSQVFSQRNSQDAGSNGSVTRIDTTYGQPVVRTISMTKIYHPGRTKSIKRMDGYSSPDHRFGARELDSSEQAIKSMVLSGIVAQPEPVRVSNVSNILSQNQNHVLRVSRAGPLPKQTIVGDVNLRSSLSLDQTRSLIQRTVISSNNPEYDETRRASRVVNLGNNGSVNRAKVIIHGHTGSPKAKADQGKSLQTTNQLGASNFEITP